MRKSNSHAADVYAPAVFYKVSAVLVFFMSRIQSRRSLDMAEKVRSAAARGGSLLLRNPLQD